MRLADKLILLTVILLSVTGYGQKFNFDTFTEYEYIKDDRSPVYKSFELSNSKDNSYIAAIVEKDESTFVLMFISEKTGLRAEVEVLKKDFFKAENITIDCNTISKPELKFKPDDVIKGYDFQRLNDTIIKKDTLLHYVFKNDDLKSSKKGDGRHYIIQKGTDFHLPNLSPFTRPYYKWKTGADFPNGLYRYSYIKFKSKITEQAILLQYTKVKKSFTLQEGCEHIK